jgi:hypothetical protein
VPIALKKSFRSSSIFDFCKQYLPRADIVGWTGHVRSGMVQMIPGNGLQVM